MGFNHPFNAGSQVQDSQKIIHKNLYRFKLRLKFVYFLQRLTYLRLKTQTRARLEIQEYRQQVSVDRRHPWLEESG